MRAPTDRPNIILVNCDDLGYGDLGCYGSTVNKTPALDRLADEGMRLTDFHMASPVCSPSRAAMMTGCQPKRVGLGGSLQNAWVLFPGMPWGLNPDEVTIARQLKQQGYTTQLVGKWHLGDQPDFLPTNHGFDHYFGLPYSNDMGRQVGREGGVPLPLLRDDQVIQQQPDQMSLTERYVEECVKFMRASRDQPFFLYLAHMHVHLPLYAAQRFLDQSDNGRYGACVEAIDWAMSVITHEVKRLGLDDNTMIVFTSDNGSRAREEGGSNAPLRGTKGTVWEGGHRVPCIVRWPGQVPAGAVCDELTSAMDFMPTFARLAGTTEPTDRRLDGKDIRPVLLGDAGATTPHEVFFHYHQDRLACVRSGKWKLHVIARELYDLEADLGETTNVIDDHPDVVETLEAHAAAARQDLGDLQTGDTGANCRPPGYVENAKPLAEYDEDHPYIIAMYDLPQAG